MFGFNPEFFLPLFNLNEKPYTLSAISISYTGVYTHLHMNLLKDVFRQVQCQTQHDWKYKSNPEKNASMSTNNSNFLSSYKQFNGV